jgi:hypothetical protein
MHTASNGLRQIFNIGKYGGYTLRFPRSDLVVRRVVVVVIE